jgi:hypothetical protein
MALSGCYRGVDRDSAGGAADETSASHGEAGEAGSEGSEGGTGEDDELGCGGSVPTVTARPLRRITPLQYRNTVRDLFGDAAFEASYDDEEYVTTERGVRQFRDDASEITSRKAEWTVDVYGCDTSGAANDQCAADFVDTFGRRVFRRPLSDEERGRLMDAYDAANAEFGFADAMDIVLQTMLQATPFLYLIEEGVAVEGAPANIRKLTDHEVANRLSYFLWDTMPDDELFAAADAGELGGKDGLRAHAERLLAHPNAEAKVQRFMSEWLQLDGGVLHVALEEANKDPALFPEFNPALQDAMRGELEAFVKEIVLASPDSNIEALFTDTRAYVNGPLAQLYGVNAGPTDESTWAWVDLKPGERSGLLTRAAFLTVFASANVPSPIRRGTIVLEEVLCNELGMPPPDVDDTTPQGGETEEGLRTVREDVEARTQGDTCQACHAFINPTGFAFEHYDAIGRYQVEEVTTGLPIDSSGELRVSDAAGEVANAIELSERIASSTTVRECFADHWLADAVSADGDALDDCAKADIVQAFTASGDIRGLIVAIVLSDNFRFLNTEGGE